MPDPVRVEATGTDAILGRHTRLGIKFRWRKEDGEFVDLGAEGYQARVWVADPDGNILRDGAAATINGTYAEYQMHPEDLATASPATNKPVHFTCVAENNDNVLPINKRAIVVGDWTGAQVYQPIS